MVIGDREFVYKYTLQEGEVAVLEGEVSECAGRKYVQFEGRGAPVKCPLGRDFNRVWADGKTLWMTDRMDEEARKIFVAYGVGRVLELRRDIDELENMIAFVKEYEFKGSSRCFVDGATAVDGLKKKPKNCSKGREESNRRYKSAWDTSEFIDINSYVDRKIEMLQKEMFIHVSDDEMNHLRGLDNQSAVDAAVRTIIDRHWDN